MDRTPISGIHTYDYVEAYVASETLKINQVCLMRTNLLPAYGFTIRVHDDDVVCLCFHHSHRIWKEGAVIRAITFRCRYGLLRKLGLLVNDKGKRQPNIQITVPLSTHRTAYFQR